MHDTYIMDTHFLMSKFAPYHVQILKVLRLKNALFLSMFLLFLLLQRYVLIYLTEMECWQSIWVCMRIRRCPNQRVFLLVLRSIYIYTVILI